MTLTHIVLPGLSIITTSSGGTHVASPLLGPCVDTAKDDWTSVAFHNKQRSVDVPVYL
jgi:hypothetical protein